MDILKQLKIGFEKETYKNNRGNSRSLKLPSNVNFKRIDENLIQIYLVEKSVLLNMQKDSAAFESWAVILKRWIGTGLNIRIKWEEPKLHFLPPVPKQHYQRFLYRVKRMSEIVHWLDVDESNKCGLNQLEIDYERSIKFIMNRPSQSRTKKHSEEDLNTKLAKLSENKLESILVFDERTAEILKNKTNTIRLFNQQPVGIFKDSKAESKAVFPGKKGAIDFLGIDNSEKTLNIFELKKFENKPAGIISELLFYCLVMNDVQNNRIKFVSVKDDFAEKIVKTSQIKGYFIAPDFHPLLDKKVVELMNKSFSGSSIQFEMLKIIQNSNGLNFENE